MRTSRLSSTVLVLVGTLLTALPALAQTGSIAGTLVEEGTLTPLASDSTTSYQVWVTRVDGAAAGSVSTNASGQYTVANLTPGSYYVKAVGLDYVDEAYDNVPCIAQDCPGTVGAPVVVTADAVTTVNFALAKGGSITGTVRRAGGSSPIAGVRVDIYNESTSYVASRTTGADGTYAVKELATGSYFARTVGYPDLSFSSTDDFIHELYGGVQCPRLAPETDCRIASGTLIAVTTGAVTSGVDFSLDQGASVSGMVTADGSNAPILGVRVYAYAGDVQMGLGTTDGSGQFTIVGLPAGGYRFRTWVYDLVTTDNFKYVDEWQNGVCVGCSGATPTVALTAGQSLTGVNFSLAVGGQITGSMRCAPGVPAIAFERPPVIDVFNSTGELVRRGHYVGDSTCFTPNTYTVEGLANGTYFLSTRSAPNAPLFGERSSGRYIDQLYGGTPCNTVDCDVRKGVPVTVTAGATTSAIDFTLQVGGDLGLLFSSPEIKIYDARGVEVINAVGPGRGFSRQMVRGMPPGTYYLTFDGFLNGGIACVDCPPTAGIPIVVGVNGNSSEPTYTRPSRRVSGTVTNASGGAPLSTINVQLVTRSGTVVGSALTDMLGRYTIKDVGAATYFARTVNDRGFVDEIYSDAGCGTCDPRSGTPIVVGSSLDPHDVTGIDFALAAGGVVSGTVSDATGVVLGTVPVSLFAGTTTFAGATSTTASGRYRLTVPAGTYRALAEATTTKGSEVYSEMPCTSAGCDPAAGAPINVTTGSVIAGINFTLTSCNAMSLSPSLLATGVVGTTYRQVLTAVGGSGPYLFDVTDGLLPLGLTLNASTGVLSGSPVVAGYSTFRVSALDANGCATDRSFVLNVQACPFMLSPTSTTVPAGGGNVTVTILNGCGPQEVTESSDWVNVQSNTPGQVTLNVAANTAQTPRTTAVGIGRRVFHVRQAAIGSQAPYGFLDLPADFATVSGAVAVGGWALDDLEVTRVRIYRDSSIAEPPGLVLLGDAVFIPGARPDVQQAAPSVPGSDRAGFGFMILTNTLPNQGNTFFRIHAIAEDAEGHSTVLGSRTIIGANTAAQQPFGTIDTPLQGQTIGGSSYVNFGWALTPQPGMIPTDGSTIQAIVDGASIGNVDYNHFRPDVSSTFPSLANSDGPVGFRVFDTTALSEGLHTISWLVTDSRPATSGLGSRYFIVANSADAVPPSAGSVSAIESSATALDVAKPLGAAPTPDLGRHAESMAVAAAGEPSRARRLTMAAMERVELALGQFLDPIADGCAATWAGYLIKDNALTNLPVGASLDPAGIFYWQTGPGFAGTFPLLFVRTNCRGEKQQVPITVTIPIR